MSSIIRLGNWQEILPTIQDEFFDLIIIDPPYLTTNEKWDKKEQVTEELSKQLFRLLKPTGNFYCWCGIGEKSQSLIRWFDIFKNDWYFKDLITWKKQRGMGNRKGWLYTREELLWFVKDNKQFIWNIENQYSNETRKSQKFGFKEHKNGYKLKSENYRLTNIWQDISENTWNWKDKIKHFTPKPEKAIERIIKLHTKENDTVLDCFMGSGTTGVVCKKMNRNFIGIEINKDYFEISSERINNDI